MWGFSFYRRRTEMGHSYKKIPRDHFGQPDKVAKGQILADLSNILLWKDLLRKSGHLIRECTPPETSGMGWHEYQLERDRIINNDLTNSEIGNYCREYGIKMHGRSCPSFF